MNSPKDNQNPARQGGGSPAPPNKAWMRYLESATGKETVYDAASKPDAVVRAPKIGVTPKGFDDMGAVLRRLNFEFEDIPVSDDGFVLALSKVNCLFVNCASFSLSARIKSAFKAFIDEGGSALCTDHAFEFVEALGVAVKFSGKVGSSQTVSATLEDPELSRLLKGSRPSLNFDMGSWVFATSIPRDARVLFKGNLNEGQSHVPLAFTVRCGRGSVCYTSFHYHAQATELESVLLSLLALQPIAAASNTTVTQLVQQRNVLGLLK